MTFAGMTVLGRAVKDAELHQAKESENVFASFTLAENRGRSKAIFYPVVVFGPTAEAASNAIKKGDKVYVEGVPNARAYSTKEGEPKAEIQVVANRWFKV